VKYALLACLLTLATLPLMAETYRWVNDEGVVTYSQTPPPDQQAERIKLRGTAAPSDSQHSQTRLDQLRQRLADREEDRQLAKKQRQETKEAQQRKGQNCEAARSNLRNLQGLGNRLYKSEGEYRRLTEEERQNLMQQARENIKANCGS
jgi:hypothetical protein